MNSLTLALDRLYETEFAIIWEVIKLAICYKTFPVWIPLTYTP